ncbi:MAG: AI-2E family transporter [Anaerolineaceae bacterium]|nr:AI-2E family transporter [Anaerolineaceae bacterium]
MESSQLRNDSFVRRALVVVGLVTAVTILVILTWQILDILLLLFLAMLFSVFLTAISSWIEDHSPLSYRLALLVTVVLLVAVVGLAGWLAAPSLAEQGEQLVNDLQTSVQDLQTTFSNQSWAEPILNRLPDPQEIGTGSADTLISRVFSIFSRTMDIVTNAVVILFVGLYLALEPDLYANGLIRLVPKSYRRRAGEVLDELAYTMRWWLVGRLASMTIVGILSVVGLYFLGIPLAFVLGVLAGLFAFIPIIGPLLALIFPVLIAFTISPTQALYVLLLYLGIQTVESYFLTPIIERKAVSLPPVLLILAQLVFGYFFNFRGLVVAAPVTAMLLMATKMLYVQDLLGDEEVELLKEDPEPHFEAARSPSAVARE